MGVLFVPSTSIITSLTSFLQTSGDQASRMLIPDIQTFHYMPTAFYLNYYTMIQLIRQTLFNFSFNWVKHEYKVQKV